MDNRLLTEDRITPVNVFRYGLIMLVVLTVIQMPIAKGRAFFSLIHPDIKDCFMDFFNSIFDAITKNPYEERGIIYPPLTQLYYRVCALVLPDGYAAREWRSSQAGLVLLIGVFAISFRFLYKTLLLAGKENDNNAKNLILWIIFGTVPFWYAIERANIIILTLAFLAYFLQNYRSDNLFKRELALISLAVAVAFKIYPVCFGVLLLMNKQYKEAFRCVIYGIVLFFLPFVFFGGVSSISVLIENILNTSTMMANLGWGYKLNIDNTLHFVAEAFHVPVTGAVFVKVMFVAAIAISLLMSKKEWQKIMALSAIMIIFPGFSFTYTMIFAAVPLIMFLVDNPMATTRNLLYSVLFLGMFAPFPLQGYELFDAAPDYGYTLNLTTVVSSISLLAMLLMMAWDTVDCRIRKHRTSPDKRCVFFGLEAHTAVIRFAFIMVLVVAAAFAAYLYCNYLYTIYG